MIEDVQSYLKYIWAKYDADESGGIDANETKTMLEDFTHHTVSLKDCKAFIKSVDQDGNGLISRDELGQIIAYGIAMDQKDRVAYASRGPINSSSPRWLDKTLDLATTPLLN